MRLPLGLLTLSFANLACSSWSISQGDPPPHLPAETTAGLAQVCVIRTSMLAMAVELPTYDNEVLVGATRGPGYFCYWVEPGRHALRVVADEDAHAELEAEPNHEYFLVQEVDNIFGYVKTRPVWVPRAKGHELVAGTSYAHLEAVPGDEKLPSFERIIPARTASVSTLHPSGAQHSGP